MKPFLKIVLSLPAVAILSACAGPRGSVADADSGERPPEQPAVRVYDPATYTYYWERDGERISSKYE